MVCLPIVNQDHSDVEGLHLFVWKHAAGTCTKMTASWYDLCPVIVVGMSHE